MSYREYVELSKQERPRAEQSRTNLRLVNESEAHGEIADSYEYFRRHFGRADIPGILKCFATHPPLLRHTIELSEALIFSEGALTRRQKEMIATFVSALNRCPYCRDSHGFFLSVHGASEETVRALLNCDLDLAGLDAGERNLLEFARKVNDNSASVCFEDTLSLHQAGWSEQQIAETVHVAALFAFFNRVANVFGLESQGLLDSQRATNLAAVASPKS